MPANGSRDRSGLEKEIPQFFADLPERLALAIWAPATKGGQEVLVQLNADQRMFAASTLKAVMLCERLRQLDSPTIGMQIANHEIPLDKSIWSPGSVIFNPPDLSGAMSERTAMEAMVIHSENTATDMVLKEAGRQQCAASSRPSG